MRNEGDVIAGYLAHRSCPEITVIDDLRNQLAAATARIAELEAEVERLREVLQLRPVSVSDTAYTGFVGEAQEATDE